MQDWYPFSERYRKFYLSAILLLLSIVFWLIYNLFVGYDFVICPTKRFLHIPCPGCGMTRAFVEIINGNVYDAIFYNANIIIVLPVFILFLIMILYDIIFLKITLFISYNIINNHINKKSFIMLFIVFEAIIECHHIFNNI